MHSGMFGGPAPDPVLGLIQLLSTLHDAHGNTTIDQLANDGRWTGVDYAAEQFRADANVLDGVELMGDGSVSDMLWSRLSATVLGIDVPPVIGSSAAIQASAAARVSLRIPNGIGGQQAQDALVEHLRSRVPWGLRCTIERVAVGDPFIGSLSGPGYESMRVAMQEAYGHEQTTEGQGGSIPLCNVLADTYPDAEIMLMGVEEPKCLIHAPNESVDPSEIEHVALSEALFLERYAAAGTR
jgi:acetylornithine deacetylase/succinyl-diaminopimelate desuccinylase-like protein